MSEPAGAVTGERTTAKLDRAAPELDRDMVVTMIAGLGARPADAVTESIDSLELAWLVHLVEQRYGIELDLDDAAMGRMATVTGALEVLRDALAGAGHG